MIDNLISSDFTALAREHRRVPSLDAVMPREREKVVRPPWKLDRWIVRAVVGGSAVMAVRSDWFDHHPQSAPLIVLSIVSLLGLFDTGAVRDSFARQLGAIFSAITIAATAATFFIADWTSPPVFAFSPDSAAWCGTDFDDRMRPFLFVGVFVVALGGALVVARVLAPRLRSRDLRLWSTLAKITTALAFVAAIGVCDFEDHTIGQIDFKLHAPIPLYYMHQQIRHTLGPVFWGWREDDVLSKSQIDMLRAAGGLALFLASIALAYRSRSKIAAKWLAIVEHVSIAPLAIAFGMANLVLSLPPRNGGPDDAAGFAAFAVVGVLVAFTSMMLRRLRRSVIAGR
jgi:hypothetical protein